MATNNEPTIGVSASGPDVFPKTLVVGGGEGVADHGALTGLGDDDHTQYTLAPGTSVTNGSVVLWDGSGGRLLQDCGVTMDAVGNINTFGDIVTSSGTISNGVGGISTVGNITVGGTVDGRDVAADGAVIDGLGSISTKDFWTGTQAAYDALTPDSNTIYFIEE
jgi:hypothetical protein